MKDAILVKKFKLRDLLKTSQRKVFHCYVIGHQSCGKVIYKYCYEIYSRHFWMHLYIQSRIIRLLVRVKGQL